MKIDLQKAFDYVSWDTSIKVMRAMKYPEQIIELIFTCITSVNYSILFNGSVKGFILGKRGLQQGDPLSLSSLLWS